MLKSISLFILLCWSVTVHSQDLSGRKYFSYNDSVFHVGDIYVVENVFYYFDSSALRPESSAGLDTVKSFLVAHPNICIEIGVHVDSRGNNYYNLKLSERRARNVFSYLISQGVDSLRLSYKGYGEEIREPEVDPRVHPINRRTEIKITSTHFSKKYYVDGIPVRGSISLPDSAIDQFKIITGGLPVVYGDINGGIVKYNSPSFECYYKISFLNQTVEYGERIGWDTISSHGNITAWDTTLSVRAFNRIICDSLEEIFPAEVVVTSCDRTEKFEVRSVSLEVLNESSIPPITSNQFIDLKQLCNIQDTIPPNYLFDDDSIVSMKIYLEKEEIQIGTYFHLSMHNKIKK